MQAAGWRLTGALAAALAQPGIRELQAPIPWQDVDLIHLLKTCRRRPQWTALEEHTCASSTSPR